MQAQMLAPAAVLVVWSLIVMLWIVPARFGAVAKMEDKSALPRKPGMRGADLEGVLPDKANWPAHNFTHLMEQPTVFYPTVLILAVTGPGALDVALAWTYVALRIIHSLWQGLVNTVVVRFALFISASLALMALAIRAVMATAFADPSALPV
ncbi:MAPEG family protein [Erythrobacter sp. NE805]|uniref:MAPEG family protein n=1 Tax=Erythrobacter sp. NE805 TaxID=3389875 RepID=UPI00396AF71D